MLTAPSEQTRRLDPEVADLFLPAVEQAKLVRLLELVLLGLECLLLLFGEALLLLALDLEIVEDRLKIAFGELFDLSTVALEATIEVGQQ